MNISLEKTSAVNAIITVTLAKADYEPKVNAALKDYRKKANIPGFRPGQAPIGLLKSRFGEEITAEEVNKMLGQELYGYIREQKLNILGEPLPNMEKQQPVDFKTMDEVSFVFDVALAPEFDAKVSASDSVDYYDITVDEATIDQQVQAYTQRNGEYKKVEEYQARDMVKGHMAELDENGNIKEGGIQVEDAVLLPEYMKNDDQKAKFNGSKVDDVIIFNPAEAYNNSDVELASMLKIKKEEAAEVRSDFSFQISEITRYEPAALTQELFDQVYGEGTVKSEEEFRAKIKESLQGQFAADSDFKFVMDLRKYMLGRVGQLEYPEEMLKRIMRLNNQDKDESYVEDNFEKSLTELTWHLVKEQLADQLEVKIEQEDVLATAKQITMMQFAQYGMANVPEEVVNNYAQEMLKNKQQIDGLVSRTEENKIAAAAKNIVTLNRKSVTMEEFNKMFSEAE